MKTTTLNPRKLLLTIAFIFCVSLNANATKKRIGIGSNQTWNQADTSYLVANTIMQYHYHAQVGDTLLLVLEYAQNSALVDYYDTLNTQHPFLYSFTTTEVKNIKVSNDTALMVVLLMPTVGEIVLGFSNVSIEFHVHLTQLVTALKENNNLPSDLIGFPNPVRDVLNLNYEVKNLKIINALGELFIEEKNTRKINLSGFMPGIYFLLINDFKKIKFIINQ